MFKFFRRKDASAKGGKYMGVAPKVLSGDAEEQGRRPTMEDAHCLYDSLHQRHKGFAKDRTAAFYGVYDGHGGQNAALAAKEILEKKLMENPVTRNPNATDDEVKAAVRQAYLDTDKEIVAKCLEEKYRDGCTSVSAFIHGKKIYVGNLGDAEMVVSKRTPEGLKAECISFRHKASSDEEGERIKAAGGFVMFGRVMGELAVSRAFGDPEYKHPQNRGTADYVSPEPYVNVYELDKDNEFLIIACDGLWDVMKYQEAVDFAAEKRAEKLSPQETARALIDLAMEKKTTDNVTVIVVYFQW